MGKILKHKHHTFEVVDSIPFGYHIWNIGKNMKEGYLPLVQLGGYDGCQVIGVKKALPLKNAQIVLSAIGYHGDTPAQMSQYVREHEHETECHGRLQLLMRALEILQSVKGVNNL